ncbi:MAG: hypothetical protein AAFY45_25040 [Bacteroidota bacterium]
MNLLNRKADFIAHLTYLSTEEGGRITPALPGYRPHIKFLFSKNMTSGQQIFLDKKMVYPGESVTAEIAIIDHVTFKHELSVGLGFEFLEGARLIGRGIILEILNEELLKPST